MADEGEIRRKFEVLSAVMDERMRRHPRRRVIDVLARPVSDRGAPRYLRSDNGPADGARGNPRAWGRALEVASLDGRLRGGGVEGPGSATAQPGAGKRSKHEDMSSSTREILEAALKLPPEERERLVEELAASLPNDFASKDIEKAWMDEIGRRSDEIDAGTAELLEWSDVRAQMAQRRRSGP